MHVQSGCSGNDSDVVIPFLPCSDSQLVDSPRLLMDGHDGLGTKHRVWFQRFGTVPANLSICYVSVKYLTKIAKEKNHTDPIIL